MGTDFSTLFSAVDADFSRHHPNFHASRQRGLATLVTLVLETRAVNLMELAAALPRDIQTPEHRYQYIERQLGNPHIVVDDIMVPYAREVLVRLSSHGRVLILQLDQSHINDICEVLMLSVRLGDRALPLAFRVRATQGAIGWEVQKELLDHAKTLIPAGAMVMLTGDRFYGTPKLVNYCQQAGWSYRIRLKGNLTLRHQGGELTTAEAVVQQPEGLMNAELCGQGVVTPIGILHEPGHKEPWIIAMDAVPSRATALDYGSRWGIEAMFSDFKSRGFGLMQSQIQLPERLEKLLLVLSLALYWAVSCGMYSKEQEATRRASKKGS